MHTHPSQLAVVKGNRRAFLKRLFGIGIGITSAAHTGSASAARRGQSANLVGFGYAIAVIEGEIPGELESEIYRAGPGRAIIFSNLTSVDIEVEVIQPNSDPSTVLLGFSWSLRVPIDHPGLVRWRVWRVGDTPGDFHEISF